MRRIYIIIIFLLLAALFFINSKTNKNEAVDCDCYSEWLSSEETISSGLLVQISKVLVKNEISGCGEFHVRRKLDNEYEYMIGCTPDGIKWKYHTVDLKNESVRGYHSKEFKNYLNQNTLLKPPY